MSDIVILSGARTGIAKFMGPLSACRPRDRRLRPQGSLGPWEGPARGSGRGHPGNVLQAGIGQNPARQAALKAGFPVSVALSP